MVRFQVSSKAVPDSGNFRGAGFCRMYEKGRSVTRFPSSRGESNNLTGPEGFEEVGHVIEVHITAAAADTVPGYNDLPGERMLLRELRYPLLVIVVNVLL